jgi:hypothetical protein
MPQQDRANTRVKDLVDLVLLIESAAMDAERLKRDIADTFQWRETHAVPDTLEPPPDFWEPVFKKLAAECGLDSDMNTQFEKVACYCRTII